MNESLLIQNKFLDLVSNDRTELIDAFDIARKNHWYVAIDNEKRLSDHHDLKDHSIALFRKSINEGSLDEDVLFRENDITTKIKYIVEVDERALYDFCHYEMNENRSYSLDERSDLKIDNELNKIISSMESKGKMVEKENARI